MEELTEKQKQAREWQRLGYSEEQAKQMAGIEVNEGQNNEVVEAQVKEWRRLGYSEQQAKEMAGASDVPRNKIPGGGTGRNSTDLKE